MTVLTAPQTAIEDGALELVRRHGLRAMDAWHLSLARLVLPDLVENGEQLAFAHAMRGKLGWRRSLASSASERRLRRPASGSETRASARRRQGRRRLSNR